MRALEFTGRRISLTIEPLFVIVMGALALSMRGPSAGYAPSDAAVLAAALALSVLLHESGHAAAVLLFGGSARVRLHGFGGETAHALKLSTGKQFLVTAAGPAAGFLTAAVCRALARGGVASGGAAVFLLEMFTINVFWSAVNLLPVLPMDGGRLLAIALVARFGAGALKYVYAVAVALGGAVSLFGLATGQLWTAAVFGIFAGGGIQSWRALSRRSPLDDDPALQKELQDAGALVDAGRGEEAAARLAELRRMTGRGRIFEVSTEVLGRLEFESGRKAEAVALLSSVEAQLSYASRVLLMGLLCEGGAHDRALAAGRALFPQKMDPQVAYQSAVACMGKGDRDAALHWLKTAVRGGLPEAPQRLLEPAFAPLRALPDFADLTRKARGD